jgi:glutathione-specific gamma-glutamylcyclotransferase
LPELNDPFVHHPELRDRIADAETSFFRTFSVEAIIAADPRQEAFRDWVHTDAQREAIRAEALAGHSGDLWIFGYGSLMWDPALRFAEVRRAHVAGHARRLILVDTGAVAARKRRRACSRRSMRATGARGWPFGSRRRMSRPRPRSCSGAR